MSGKSKTCAWCSKPTNLPAVYAAATPLMEWMEEKINMVSAAQKINRKLIWGENSDWGKLNLPPAFELELLAYDRVM